MGDVRLGTDDTVRVLKQLLDLNSARQKVAARNLANSDAEGYQPQRVGFAEELDRAAGKVELARTDPRHLTAPRAGRLAKGYTIEPDEELSVESQAYLEESIARLADAEIAYSTAARLMSKRTATIRTAITGNP
jgi:flagellar basal-body rod protein FlgB